MRGSFSGGSNSAAFSRTNTCSRECIQIKKVDIQRLEWMDVCVVSEGCVFVEAGTEHRVL